MNNKSEIKAKNLEKARLVKAQKKIEKETKEIVTEKTEDVTDDDDDNNFTIDNDALHELLKLVSQNIDTKEYRTELLPSFSSLIL